MARTVRTAHRRNARTLLDEGVRVVIADTVPERPVHTVKSLDHDRVTVAVADPTDPKAV